MALKYMYNIYSIIICIFNLIYIKHLNLMMNSKEIQIDTILLDRFLVKEKIGKGSFGIVYEGVEIKTNKKIAIKIVRI